MLNEIPMKIPMAFLTGIENSTLKFLQAQKTLNRQSNTDQKENDEGITISDFKLYYRVTAINQHGIGTKIDT
jgi:hypothetical protein